MNNLNLFLLKHFYFLLIAIVFLLCTSCSDNDSQNTIWGKAAKFVKVQSSENYLTNEDPVFLSMEQPHTPSAWVEYFFSVYSTRNWITEEDEYAEYSRGPGLPAGINLSKFTRNDTIKKPQLVIKADGSRSMIIVEGYDYPINEIVYNEEWEFPRFKKN